MIDRDGQPLIGEFPSLPKQERAYQKREALLESGRKLFSEKGYAEFVKSRIEYQDEIKSAIK